jgi:oligopeptide/dipeptide ABC transporter ATP-binding protein
LTTPLLQVQDLHVELEAGPVPVRPVDGVSFDIQPGETLGVVGESGCGKTMTAFSIIGLLPPNGRITGGSVVFDGQDLTRLSASELRRVRGDRIGMVFQDPMTALNPTMTLFDQVAEPLVLHRQLGSREIRERVVDTLQLVGLPDLESRLKSYPHQLSGGLRQRVAIAIALVCQPKLLIADEPSTALDVTIQRQILDLIDALKVRLSMSVMLITHDLGVVAGHTDRVAVMYAGRIAETAQTPTLFADPRHRYTEGLFAALPERAASRHEPLYTIPGAPPDLAYPPDGCRFAPRCGFATDACRATEPQLLPFIGEPEHLFACIHPVGAPIERQPVVRVSTQVNDSAARAGVGASRPVLEVHNLVKTYAVSTGGLFKRHTAQLSATADVSFSVSPGETFGLVGESGCGKSTIARMIVALERPTAGKILVDGVELSSIGGSDLRRRRRDVHLMFQDPSASMNGRMRALDVLREPFAVQAVGNRRSQDAKIATLLDDVGLPRSMADRYPHELSGGQRQRLALARALALEPKLIVADEPVSALDVSIQAQILNLMQTLQKARGVSYVFISHDLSVVRYMASRIGVMYLGKLVEEGPADRVYQRPLHPYTRGLIDAVPVPEPGRKRAAQVRGDLPSPLQPPSGCRFRTRCPLAKEICAAVEPPLVRHSTGQSVACHFPLVDSAAAATAPPIRTEVPA